MLLLLVVGIVTSFNNDPVSSVAYNIKKGAIAKRGDSVIKAAMITLKSPSCASSSFMENEKERGKEKAREGEKERDGEKETKIQLWL